MTVRDEEGGAPPVQNVNPNAVESLADLAQAAAVLDNPAPAPGAAGPAAAPAVASELVDEATAEDLAGVLRMARDMAAPLVEAMGYLPPGRIVEIWTDAVMLAIAEPAVEIMRRHGMALGDALTKLGPYVGLLLGLYGPSMATYAAIQMHAVEVARLKTEGGSS